MTPKYENKRGRRSKYEQPVADRYMWKIYWIYKLKFGCPPGDFLEHDKLYNKAERIMINKTFISNYEF